MPRIRGERELELRPPYPPNSKMRRGMVLKNFERRLVQTLRKFTSPSAILCPDMPDIVNDMSYADPVFRAERGIAKTYESLFPVNPRTKKREPPVEERQMWNSFGHMGHPEGGVRELFSEVAREPCAPRGAGPVTLRVRDTAEWRKTVNCDIVAKGADSKPVKRVVRENKRRLQPAGVDPVTGEFVIGSGDPKTKKPRTTGSASKSNPGGDAAAASSSSASAAAVEEEEDDDDDDGQDNVVARSRRKRRRILDDDDDDEEDGEEGGERRTAAGRAGGDDEDDDEEDDDDGEYAKIQHDVEDGLDDDGDDEGEDEPTY